MPCAGLFVVVAHVHGFADVRPGRTDHACSHYPANDATHDSGAYNTRSNNARARNW